MIPEKFERIVEVTLPWSSKLSKNRLYRTKRGGGMYIDRDARNIRAQAAFFIKRTLGATKFEKAPVWLIIRVTKPDMRSDAINLIDGIADVVKGVIGVDDRYFHCVCTWDLGEPKIVIRIAQ